MIDILDRKAIIDNLIGAGPYARIEADLCIKRTSPSGPVVAHANE